jgi:hypothetical protein
MDLSDHT